MTDTTGWIAGLLAEHREDALTCYDHLPTPDCPVWCCECGAHELLISHREHVATVIAEAIAHVDLRSRVEALLERLEAWDGTWPHPDSSSPNERDRLRDLLDGGA